VNTMVFVAGIQSKRSLSGSRIHFVLHKIKKALLNLSHISIV
jgi:hypothetical protein